MRNILYLTVVINAVIVSSQPLTNASPKPRIIAVTTTATTTSDITTAAATTATTTTGTTASTTAATTAASSPETISAEVQTEILTGNESSSLSANQYVYHTVNTTSEPLLDVHLLGEIQKINLSADPRSTDGEETLTEASEDILSLDGQRKLNVSSHPEATDGEETMPGSGIDIILVGEQHTLNLSSDPGVIDGETNSMEPGIDIHLEGESHKCTENVENETLSVSCSDATSLYIYAKKSAVDTHNIRIRVANVSGALDLSLIIGLNSTLRELDLEKANITAFSYTGDSHQDFKNLEKLNLNSNAEFHAPSFVKLGHLPNLDTLKIHGLKLDKRIVTFLKAVPNITHLDISNTGIRHLPSEFFENVPKLKILDASMNDLHYLKLEKEFVSRLIHLNVSRCSLETLEIENGGKQDPIIQVLDVSHNGLPALKSGLVSRLAPDAHLHVNDNEWECSSCSLYHLWEYLQKRTQVSGGSHIKSCFDLSSLAKCDWDECPCGCTCTEATKTVDCSALDKSIIPGVGPSDTQVLILNNNKITSLKNINSSSWCQLREIQIDRNSLSNFDTTNLQGSCSCKGDYEEEECIPQALTISAAYNHIENLQNNDCDFLQETKFLNLSHNEITRIHNCGHSIKYLDVSYNRIEKMEVSDLGSLPLIENLILSNNQLTYFYRYEKNITPNLKHLDLSHNKINRIEDRLSLNDTKSKKGWEFDPEVPFKLDELYLHDNQLGDSGGVLMVTNISKSLEKITLHNNPWDCDCAFCESFKEFEFASIDAVNKMVCRTPYDTPVIDYLMNCTCNEITQREANKPTVEDKEENNTKEDHRNQESITNLIVIVVIAMILVGLFLWLCRFNTFVTKTLNGGQTQAELADETQRRRYDVFVVHAGEDRDFVNENVITPLAAKGYLVAWHENMFIPGNYIYENIERAVKQSRRMLVVATGNFTKSHWGIKEIRRGRHEEVDVPGFKITALVTNSLPRELKPELYQIVQERTHVAFSDRDYLEKICNFLPRPDPRMVPPLNDADVDNSINQLFRQILTARNSTDGNRDSHPTVFQVFHDAQNDQVTINEGLKNQSIDDAEIVTEHITIIKSRFKVLPVNDESYARNAIHSNDVSFRRRLSGASSVETFPAYTCLPPTPDDEDDEDDFLGPKLSRGIFVRVSCRF